MKAPQTSLSNAFTEGLVFSDFQRCRMEVVRKVYILILCSAFAYGVLKSYVYMLEEHTTFEESTLKNHGILPSLTFCVNQYKADNFTQIEDVLNAIERGKDMVSGHLRFIGHGLQPEKLDIKNVSVLSKLFNVTLDELWSYGVNVNSKPPFPIGVCTTLNLPFIKAPNKTSDITLDVKIHQDYYLPYQTKSIRLEKHEPYQSLHNIEFDWLGTMELVSNATGIKEVLTTMESILLKQKAPHCYEDNSMRITSCIDDVISNELDCNLPWVENSHTKNICTGSEKLNKLREFYYNLNSKQTQEKLKKCLKPNCRIIKWKKSYKSEWSRSKGILVQVVLPSNSYTIRRKEILLADLSTFTADFGSYLGLFLGTSFLSFSDILVVYFVWAKNAIFGKQVKSQKQPHQNPIPKTRQTKP